MDLQTASKLSGQRWQVARFAALAFLTLACGLLAVSLGNNSPAAVSQTSVPTWPMH
jgi:hypothetical protein